MTPAVRLLKKQRIDFEVVQYGHDPNNSDFGQEAIEKLKLNTNEVFKTLLVDVGKKDFVVVIVSMNKQLCLKSVAKACGVKKSIMADKHKVQAVTGYLLGGISPLAQKKQLKTFIDQEAKSHEMIYVSGGRRGLEIRLKTSDLAALLAAQFIDLSSTP